MATRKAKAERAVDDAPTELKVVHPKNPLNDLTSTEWLPETISVWNQRGLGANHPDAAIEREHPAPFSYTDVSRLIRFFTKREGVVLDPFVGVGSTLKACAIESRRGIGFELNPKYVSLTKQRLKKEVSDPKAVSWQEIRKGDARKLVLDLEENSLDFVVTSPPYWNILHKEDHKAKQERIEKDLDTRYSNDKADLGNIHDYDGFLDALGAILGACARPLKPKKYMAVIVSDFRDKSNYLMFHADVARILKPHGLELRGLTVLYQRHKRIFPYGYPYAFVPNIHNQFIVLLQNAKK
jgi:DNA modification methylase